MLHGAELVQWAGDGGAARVARSAMEITTQAVDTQSSSAAGSKAASSGAQSSSSSSQKEAAATEARVPVLRVDASGDFNRQMTALLVACTSV